jgi:hypothetical protein
MSSALATIVEAYPIDAASPSYRFMGFVDAFASAGFQEVGRAGQRRHVMPLVLSDSAHQEGASRM